MHFNYYNNQVNLNITLDRSDIKCLKLENVIKYELTTSKFKIIINIITTNISTITSY